MQNRLFEAVVGGFVASALIAIGIWQIAQMYCVSDCNNVASAQTYFVLLVFVNVIIQSVIIGHVNKQ